MLRVDVGSECSRDRRMKLLLLSHDDALATRLATALGYGVRRVEDAIAARDYIERHGDAIALVMDSALCTTEPEPWLVGLRTALASTGLPGLFILRHDTDVLRVVLDSYGAAQMDFADVNSDALVAVFNRLLHAAQTE